MLRLDVGALKKAPGNFVPFSLAAELSPLELRGEHMAFSAPVKADLLVGSSDATIVEVEGTVSGRLNLQCGRCLEYYEHVFAVPFREVYAQEGQNGESEVIPYSGELLDITPEVLKTIILSLPMKTLCREDCLGLCPLCGGNLNNSRCDCSNEDVDPRLSVLQKLFKENNDGCGV